MATVSGIIDGTGSAGSAIGQFVVPVIENQFGWNCVFYLFIVMVGDIFNFIAHRYLVVYPSELYT